jgi:NAD-dependent DNA ligase
MQTNDNTGKTLHAIAHDRAIKIWHGLKESAEGVKSYLLPTLIALAAVIILTNFINIVNSKVIIGSNSGIVFDSVSLAPADKIIGKSPFYKKKVVFTGKLKWGTRREAEAQMSILGAAVRGDVTSATDYLIAGKNPGKKLKKAREYGTVIFNESEWLALIN